MLSKGHNFRTEGVAPIGWIYMDGKYIRSVHRRFGELPMKTYPNMLMSAQLRWMIVRRIKKIRPLWYLEYDKETVKEFLAKEYGWEWYGGTPSRKSIYCVLPQLFHTETLRLRYAHARLLGRLQI